MTYDLSSRRPGFARTMPDVVVTQYMAVNNDCFGGVSQRCRFFPQRPLPFAVPSCSLCVNRHQRYTRNISAEVCRRAIFFRAVPFIDFLVLSVNLIPLPSKPDLPVPAPTTSSHSVNSPLSPSITPSLFHSRLKTYLFHKSFPP